MSGEDIFIAVLILTPFLGAGLIFIALFIYDFYIAHHNQKVERKIDSMNMSFRYINGLSTPHTTFACDRPSIKMVELIEGDGLFPMGVKAMFDIPTNFIELAKANKTKPKIQNLFLKPF